jgi:uncharacterized protein
VRHASSNRCRRREKLHRGAHDDEESAALSDFALLAAAGLLVGAIVGLTGVGGGSIMTPLLITVFGVPAPVAVGTDLANAAATKTAGTLAHLATRTVIRPIAVLLALGSVPAAITALTILAMTHFTPHELDRFIRECVGVALFISIAMLLLRDPIRRWAARSEALRRGRRYRPALTVLVGAAIGVAVSLTSLGAGAIGAACLALLYPELEPADIAGTDIAHAMPLAAVAAAGHAWLGTIDWMLLLALLSGGVPGIVLGSLTSRRLPVRALRIALVATLALAGVKLLA